MGCDLHMYIQYREKERANSQYDWWLGFGGRINPGRDYSMFGILSDGVRSTWSKSFEARGVPKKLGLYANNDLYIPIREENDDSRDYGEYSVTLEQAERWGTKIICDDEGKPYKTSNPDWHSHSWLTVDEYAQALKWYRKQAKRTPSAEYRAILKAMKELEDKGKNDVMVVFWFDN